MNLTKIPAQMLLSGGASGEGTAGFINPEAYGMDPSASGAVNKAALKAAVAAGPVMIPAKSYTLSGFQHSGPIHMVGQGIATRLTFTGSGAGIHLPVSSVNFGSVIDDFTMNHETPGGGTHGIHVEMLDGGYFGKWQMFNIYNDLSDRHQFGQNAVYLDNSGGAADGIATGVIEGCQLTAGAWAGIHGDLIGDSIKITRNVVNAGAGIAIDLSQVSGARQIVIEDNNLTTFGGGLLLDSCGQTFVNRNWVEHPAYLSEFLPTRVDAQLTLFNCYNCYVTHNTIRGGAGDLGPGGTPITGANYGVVLSGTTQLSTVKENWIAAVAIVRTYDSSGSGTNVITDNVNG